MYLLITDSDGTKTAITGIPADSNVYLPNGATSEFVEGIYEESVVESYVEGEGSELVPIFHAVEENPSVKMDNVYAGAMQRLLTSRLIHAKGVSYPALSRTALEQFDENADFNEDQLFDAVIGQLIN